MFLPLLRSLRPHQWVKNGFVLVPLVFASKLTDLPSVILAAQAFALFCLASSAIYLINDLRDREEDRQHPIKRLRPLAAGTLSPGVAIAAAVVLVVAVGVGSWPLGPAFVGFIGSYIGLQVLYSSVLKRLVILDVMSIAVGFVLRVLGGAAAIHVDVSRWLLLCTIFIALFLAFSKRRHELLLLPDRAAEQRGVLSHYSPTFLDQMINVVTASSLVSYTLYTTAPDTIAHYGSENLVFTVPLVLYGIFRYLYLMYQRPSERNPTEAILTDAPFLINMLLWGLVVGWMVYFGS